MGVFISAVIGDLTNRSLNFITSKFSKPTPVNVEDRLRRVLLRAQVTVDEAIGRHITNQAMLLQLSMLRDAMYRGYYKLDSFSYQSHDGDNKDKFARPSSSLSKVNSLKRLSFSSRNTLVSKQLQEAHDDLRSMILDMEELTVFLTSYPRMYRQPYSMHLQLGNCMFGLQMEAQLVINFLLRSQSHCTKELDVLPVVGPSHVGKSTLIAHVCKDERVNGHFSTILFFRIYEFTEDDLATFRKECTIKHQNLMSDPDGRWLVVIEFIWDLNEDAWNMLYSASKRCVPTGSKIIVTSKYDKIVKFGTTQAVTLNYLPHEAYWYFFKTLTFGSTDPEMHPKLTHLAMEIAKILKTAIAANVTASLLRDNFNTHFWCNVLTFLRRPVHKLRCGEDSLKLLNKNIHAHLRRMVAPSHIVVKREYQRFSEEEVPEIRVQDVMYGSVRPDGEFEALAWRSQIPPYYSYAFVCEIQKVKGTATKRKRRIL
ncbi:hypothetical protein HU200_063660 [Digitaria exilis]|uniref:NB-ARC domain-containing protein n=1 Tax=Digitaria exilis TaxID=1010633 RepID=A0A835A4J5_9POAL|nr:hypothetical protein HU200_063660 [Digitaria exilis]